jgi:hypothetical protein
MSMSGRVWSAMLTADGLTGGLAMSTVTPDQRRSALALAFSEAERVAEFLEHAKAVLYSQPVLEARSHMATVLGKLRWLREDDGKADELLKPRRALVAAFAMLRGIDSPRCLCERLLTYEPARKAENAAGRHHPSCPVEVGKHSPAYMDRLHADPELFARFHDVVRPLFMAYMQDHSYDDLEAAVKDLDAWRYDPARFHGPDAEPSRQMDSTGFVMVTVNGHPRSVPADAKLTYEDIVRMAGLVTGHLYSLTYVHGGPAARDHGMLGPGQSVEVNSGIIFNVADTSRA